MVGFGEYRSWLLNELSEVFSNMSLTEILAQVFADVEASLREEDEE